MTETEITRYVKFGPNDDECLPITKCKCGREFEPWEFTISIYSDYPTTCPGCGRKLFFRLGIRVYEVN